MPGSSIGRLFRVENFGESHGPAIGCVVDGCPAGLMLSEADIQTELDRRRPDTSRFVTQRREPDAVEILSGVYEGCTTGTPIALLIRNTDQKSRDYSAIAENSDPDTRTLVTGRSLVSATRGAAGGRLRASPRRPWQPVPLRRSFSARLSEPRSARVSLR